MRIHLTEFGMKELVNYSETPPIKCSYESCYFYSRVSYHPKLDRKEEIWCSLRDRQMSYGGFYCDRTFFLKQLLERL